MSATLLAESPAAVRPVAELLDGIPSETTPAERRLLHTLFRDRWAGAGHVVEIGPFLGGTTRAIALGVAANPHLDLTVELHTFDRFDACYSAAELRATIEPILWKDPS